jgi:uncharacterized protein (UPF0332 family)
VKSSDEQRQEIVKLRLENARQALADAAALLERSSFRAAVNRCYYAMYYAASALALKGNKTFHKHSGLIAFFHAEFVKPGLVSRDLGRILQKGFDNRSEADYQDVVRFTPADVESALQEAQRFVREVESYLATVGG